MDDFARLPAEDRQAFIEEAAGRRDVTAIVIEKDLWVCWRLRRLMEVGGLAGHLTFKGGTSLSKAFGIIARLSEDIGLVIGRAAPLIGKIASPWKAGSAAMNVSAAPKHSRKQRGPSSAMLQFRCSSRVSKPHRLTFRPASHWYGTRRP